MRRLEYTEAMEQRHQSNPKMILASKEFAATAMCIDAEFEQKVIANQKRRRRLKLGAWIGAGALVLGYVAGSIIYMNSHDQTTASDQNHLSATELASNNCYPIQPESPLRTIMVPKAALPPNPTNIEIASDIARQVPGSSACGGYVGGANHYQSFIALLEIDQPMKPNSSNIESLAKIFKEQSGTEVTFLAPTGIYAQISS